MTDNVHDFSDAKPNSKEMQSALDEMYDSCTRCGGEIPSFEQHGLQISEDGEHVCADCSRSDPSLGGYHIEDGKGNRIYG